MLAKLLIVLSLLAPVVTDYCSPGAQWYVVSGPYWCPNGELMSYACSSDCAETLRTTMDGYTAQACWVQTSINDWYQEQQDQAADDFRDCLDAGVNPDSCAATYTQTMNDLNAAQQQELADLDSAFAAARAAAEADFEACLAACCETEE